MKTYKVYIFERVMHSIELESETFEDVRERAYNLLRNGTTKELNECNYSYEGKFTDDEVLEIGEK